MLPSLIRAPSGGDQVTSMPWDAQGEAQAALRAIVADSRYGPAALSNAPTMTNLLKDMLPDAPRESSVLIAASEAGLADMLRTNVSQGMDLATASRLAAGSFENRTALTSDACAWAAGVLASVLRLDAVRPAPPRPAGHGPDTARPFGSDQQTMAARPVPAPPPWITPTPVSRIGAGPPDGLRLATGVVTGVGAILVIWACALPDLYVPNGDRTSFSIFNSGAAGDLWFAVEPVAVAVLAAAAALITMRAGRSARTRLLASGILVGFGVQTSFLFAGYEFYVRSPDHAGPGGAVGILGGLLVLVAGLIAAASRPPSTAPAGGQESG
jgi:hypothetical protein